MSSSRSGNNNELIEYLLSLGRQNNSSKKDIIVHDCGTFSLRGNSTKEFFQLYNKLYLSKSIRDTVVQENPRTKMYSGIYLDMDPLFETHIEYKTSDIFKFIELSLNVISSLINIEDGSEGICFVTVCKEKKMVGNLCKSGFHLIFPSIWVNYKAKAHILRQMMIDPQIIEFFKKKNAVNRIDEIVDQNLSTNQVLLFGSKKSTSDIPYDLFGAYKFTKECNEYQIDDEKGEFSNLPFEMSICYENPEGIKAKTYRTALDQEMVFEKDRLDDLSIELINLCEDFPNLNYWKSLIDNIPQDKLDNVMSWKTIMKAIGNINHKLIPLAKYASLLPYQTDKYEINKYEKSETEKLIKNLINEGSASSEKWGEGYLCKLVIDTSGLDTLKGLQDHNIHKQLRDIMYKFSGKFPDIPLSNILTPNYYGTYVTTSDERRECWYYTPTYGQMAYKWNKSPLSKPPRELVNAISKKLIEFAGIEEKRIKNDIKVETDEDKQKMLKFMYGEIKKSKHRFAEIGIISTIARQMGDNLFDKMFESKLNEHNYAIGMNGGILLIPKDANEEEIFIQKKNHYNVSMNTGRNYIKYDKKSTYIKEIKRILREGFYISEEDYINGQKDGSVGKKQRLIPYDNIRSYDKESFKYYLGRQSMSLSREPKDHPLVIVYGPGSNIKSTSLNLFANTMGDDYSVTTGARWLSDVDLSSGGPDPIASQFENKNSIIFEEGKEAKELNEEKLKRLLSPGTKYMTRELYKNSKSFLIKGIITEATNYLPIISSTKHAMWKRILCIRMTATFKKKHEITEPFHREVNEDIQKTWVSDPNVCDHYFAYLLHLRKKILKLPNKFNDIPKRYIDKCTNDYRLTQDVMEEFIQKKLEVRSGSEVDLLDIADEYETWYKNNKNSFKSLIRESTLNKLCDTRLSKDIKKSDGMMILCNYIIKD